MNFRGSADLLHMGFKNSGFELHIYTMKCWFEQFLKYRYVIRINHTSLQMTQI